MIRISRLRSADDPAFARAMSLYAVSFPHHEQREAASQRRILANASYHFGLVYDDDAFAGIVLYWDAEAFVYVEHFCVLPELRGRGIGTQALRLLTQAGKAVILEIDPPVTPAALRRKGFYERAGFVSNPYPHTHPAYHAGLPGHALAVMSSPRPLTQAEYDAFFDYLCAVVMGA